VAHQFGLVVEAGTTFPYRSCRRDEGRRGVVKVPQQPGEADERIVAHDVLGQRTPGHLALDEGQDLPAEFVDAQMPGRAVESGRFQVAQQRAHGRRRRPLRASYRAAHPYDSPGQFAVKGNLGRGRAQGHACRS
jgi:hypothetical protein